MIKGRLRVNPQPPFDCNITPAVPDVKGSVATYGKITYLPKRIKKIKPTLQQFQLETGKESVAQ